MKQMLAANTWRISRHDGEFESFLSMFSGKRAELWAYNVTHSRLAVRFACEEASLYYPVFCGVEELSARAGFQPGPIIISSAGDSDLLVHDAITGFRIVCYEVFLFIVTASQGKFPQFIDPTNQQYW